MFAIVEIAGLQYKVEQDQKLFVNRLKGDKGGLITLGKAVKVELEKNILTHEEVDAAIIKNIDQFKALNK